MFGKVYFLGHSMAYTPSRWLSLRKMFCVYIISLVHTNAPWNLYNRVISRINFSNLSINYNSICNSSESTVCLKKTLPIEMQIIYNV